MGQGVGLPSQTRAHLHVSAAGSLHKSNVTLSGAVAPRATRARAMSRGSQARRLASASDLAPRSRSSCRSSLLRPRRTQTVTPMAESAAPTALPKMALAWPAVATPLAPDMAARIATARGSSTPAIPTAGSAAAKMAASASPQQPRSPLGRPCSHPHRYRRRPRRRRRCTR